MLSASMGRLTRGMILLLALIGMYLLATALPVFATGGYVTADAVGRLLFGFLFIGAAGWEQRRSRRAGSTG